MYFAATDGYGVVVPSEVVNVKSWNITDFFELLEYKLEDAERRK